MASSISLADFYPEKYAAEAEETPNGVTQKSVTTQKTEQNRTPTDISKKDTKPPTPAELARQERKNKLINALVNKCLSFTEACREAGVGRTQGYEYFNEWIQTEEAQYLHHEWIHLYHQLKQDNPEKAFDGLTKLLGMKQKKAPEVNVNLNQTIDVTAATDALIQFSRKNTATTDEQK